MLLLLHAVFAAWMLPGFYPFWNFYPYILHFYTCIPLVYYDGTQLKDVCVCGDRYNSSVQESRGVQIIERVPLYSHENGAR